MATLSGAQIYSADRSRSSSVQCWLPAPIVQRPRTPPFQGGNGDSNSPGGTSRGRGEVWSSRRPVKPEVAGSNPVAPARSQGRSGLRARAPLHGQVAQLVEHRSEKPGVGSSILPLTTILRPLLRQGFRRSQDHQRKQNLRLRSATGALPLRISAHSMPPSTVSDPASRAYRTHRTEVMPPIG